MNDMIPYGRQCIGADDIEAVASSLSSDWLTTGPEVEAFERDVATVFGAQHAVAVNSGTAALHAAMRGVGVGPGDEVIVPAMTFVASANAVIYEGGTPVFADVDPDTLLVDPASVAAVRTERTKALIAVDYAGQPCDYEALRLAAPGIRIIADACHAPGATDRGRPVGTLADASTLSLHPVKHFTSGEGGIVLTNDAIMAARMCRFRNHGIDSDHRQRSERGTYAFDMVELGYNYRITDFQCALARSQLRKLPSWLKRRRSIAARYDTAFAESEAYEPLAVRPNTEHAYHIYVVRLRLERLGVNRKQIFAAFREAGIGVNVHYQPVYLHSFYREAFGHAQGLCPVAEKAYERILSLPIYPAMNDIDVGRVIEVASTLGRRYLRRSDPVVAG